jgi:hypothetical protein
MAVSPCPFDVRLVVMLKVIAACFNTVVEAPAPHFTEF